MAETYKTWFRHALELARSPNPAERESVVIGTNEADNSPFYVPIKLLLEHLHGEGPSGQGKTASLAALMEQIAHRRKFSLVVLDMKGDSLELLAAVKDCGLPVRWFTDRVGYSTFTLNLFEQRYWKRLTPAQKASTIGAALGTTHGLSGYGNQWFGGSAFEVEQRTFERTDVKSFRGLSEAIHHLIIHGKRDDIHSDIRAAGLQAYLDTRRMASVQALNVVGNPHGIDLCSVFETPQVLYFSLPSAVSHDVAGAIFRLVLFGLFDAAGHVSRQVPVVLFADEFQRGISQGLETVLQQARSCGIGLVLANQTIHDLVTKEKDFRPTMKACCRLHWQYGEASPDMQLELSETGGTYPDIEETETIERTMVTGKNSKYRWTKSWTHRIVDRQRLPINEIKRVTGHPRLSFFTSSADWGLFQYGHFPQVVESDYHITREEYERRKAMPWPSAVPGCIVTEMPDLVLDPAEHPEDPPPVPRIGRPAKPSSPLPRRSKE